MKKIYLYSVFIWFLFSVFAIINGTIRQFVYLDLLGDLSAHQLSTIIFVFVMLLIMHVFFNKLNLDYKKKDLVNIGLIWTIFTILFEFGFGHYIVGHSWTKLFYDYNIFQGHIWILVLLTSLFGPYLVGRTD